MTKDEFLTRTNPGDFRTIITEKYDMELEYWYEDSEQGTVHVERSDPNFFFLMKPVKGSAARDPSVIRYSEVLEVF